MECISIFTYKIAHVAILASSNIYSTYKQRVNNLNHTK